MISRMWVTDTQGMDGEWGNGKAAFVYINDERGVVRGVGSVDNDVYAYIVRQVSKLADFGIVDIRPASYAVGFVVLVNKEKSL